MSQPENLIDLQTKRAERGGRPLIDPEVADAMVMTHLAGCGMQLNLISNYFLSEGLMDIGIAVGNQANAINEICKKFVKPL